MRSSKAGSAFRLQKAGHRDAYHEADDAGMQLPPGDGVKDGYQEGLPETLSPRVDVDAVRDRVALAVPVGSTILS